MEQGYSKYAFYFELLGIKQMCIRLNKCSYKGLKAK